MNPKKINSILNGAMIIGVCLFVVTPSVASLTGSEAADELIDQMDGKYGRVYIFDDGRAVVQIETLEPGAEPTDPPVFVEENNFRFEPVNQLSSLKLLLSGANKYIDVDDETAGALGGGKDLTTITFTGDSDEAVSEIEGDVHVSQPTISTLAITVSNSQSGSSLTFSAHITDLELEDVSAGQQGSGFCCQVSCDHGPGVVPASCIICICTCSFDRPFALCLLNRIELTLLAPEV